PGAAANIRPRPVGWRSLRKRRSSARINSSGVPIPTKPETPPMSQSRMMAMASSAETILFLSIHSVSVREPLGDARAEQGLRLAADEDAHVAARQRQLGVVLGADLGAERLRRRRRDDVVVLGEDVEHRHGDVAKIDLPAVDGERAGDELFVLVQILQPFFRRVAPMMLAVG